MTSMMLITNSKAIGDDFYQVDIITSLKKWSVRLHRSDSQALSFKLFKVSGNILKAPY